MHAIDDDDEVFTTIKKGNYIADSNKHLTHSQEQMVNAFDFFETILKKSDAAKLKTIQDILENAVVGVIPIANRVEAAQIFEYQNSRGISHGV
ncbi:hypothetical protein AGMMS50267_17890 [Spirochaetia bacterium]|nr:hypothetical protein AGMMS50267_17890 [Spirochaetia bacterium]